MSEHDAPTVARAMVWLDTSHDARTRRRDRIGYADTARALDHGGPIDERETTRYDRAALSETAALGTASALPAPARSEIDTRAQARLVQPRLPPAARARERAQRWLALAGCAGALMAAFMLGRASASATARSVLPRAVPSAATGPSASTSRSTSTSRSASASTSTAKQPPLDGHQPPASSPAAPPSTDAGEQRASPRSAVEALARGDYPRALALYRALASRHPNDAAFAVIVKLLGARQRARCRAQNGEAVCDG